MIIGITGERGVGKTTVLKKVIKELNDVYGIISERFDGGFYVEDVKTGKKMVLASEREKIGFKLRKFYFNPEAIKFMERALQRGGRIMVYDEIGYLELLGYFDVFKYIKEDCVLIVRKDFLDEISKQIPFDVVFEVTVENRDWIWRKILETLKS
ncbi:nucleoside-triphosphatase [Thermococcus paralvinellae]|uniref:Uncharacterized protein n=1 Tax=Thermococcus paralvinellae TaxID=582419 RepID=W0I4X5_9EURY|nr:nucleoside-triphosphatase [Thermococcus paralvinellae]AHF79480.1 Hypothetical protein TES1_0083 [Thermococcus paralvinellae]